MLEERSVRQQNTRWNPVSKLCEKDDAKLANGDMEFQNTNVDLADEGEHVNKDRQNGAQNIAEERSNDRDDASESRPKCFLIVHSVARITILAIY